MKYPVYFLRFIIKINVISYVTLRSVSKQRMYFVLGSLRLSLGLIK